MKKVINTCAILVLTMSLFAFAQEKNVPKEVSTSFKKRFPEAKHIVWEKETATEYEAEFRWHGKEYSANFLEDGTWKETEYEIEKEDLTTDCKNTIAQEYANYKLKEFSIIDTATGTYYEVEMKKGKVLIEVVLTKEGKVISTEDITKGN